MKTVVKNKIIFCLGLLSLVLGFIGAFVPLLPTTPFVLLAAWAFLRSSPKMHSWLLEHKIFGPSLKDWEDHGAISTKAKFIAIVMIAFSLGVIWWRVTIIEVKVGVSILLVGVSLFILTRPSVKRKNLPHS